MLEQDFANDHIVPRLRKVGHCVYVQNSAESGTPDLNYAVFPRQGWIEVKVAKSGWLYFEKFQIPWIRKRHRAFPFSVWVLARIGQEAALYSAETILSVDTEPYRKWVRCRVESLTSIAQTGLSDDWSGIMSVLTDPS